MFRYVKYLIFPLLLVINLTQNKMVFRLHRVDKDFLYYTLLWLFVCFFSVLFGAVFNGSGELSMSRIIKEIYFINTALLSILLLFNISTYDTVEKVLRLFIIFACIQIFIIDFHKIVALLSYRSSIFYFTTPPTETFLTTVFGAAFIYYLTKKDKKMMILTFLLAAIGAKRIVILAVLATTILYFILKPFKGAIVKNKFATITVALLVNFFIAGMLVALTFGAFDEIIFELTGIPPNWLFSGRVAMYKDVFSYMGSVPYLPKGLGYIGTILVDKKIHYNDFFVHMHSDVLKYMIEFGLLLFIVVFGYMYKVALKNYNAFILVVYFNILMVTDNPSILYEFYLFFYIMFMLLLLQPANKAVSQKTTEKQVNTVQA
jgi:hypothetical protein